MDFIEIDKENFRKLYEESDLTNKEIAKKLGCSEGVVNQRANKWKFKKYSKYAFFTEDLLEDLYCKKGMSMQEIAKKYNATKRTVQRKIEFFGLKPKNSKQKYNIKEEDLRKYVEQGMTLVAIAQIYGCSDKPVRDAIKKYHIKLERRKYIIDSNELKKLYYEDKLSINAIAKIYKCQPNIINIRLKELGRKVKSRKNRVDIDNELLRKCIEEDGLTYEETASVMGLNIRTIAHRARRLKLRKMKSKIRRATYEELYELFIVQQKTYEEIANIYNCNKSLVSLVLRDMKINRTLRKKVLLSDEELKRLYIDEKMSIRKIHNLTGAQERHITDSLHRLNINVGGKWEWITKDILIELYIKQNMNVPEIAKKLGCPKGSLSTKVNMWALNDMRSEKKHKESINRSFTTTTTRSKGEDEILKLYPTCYCNDCSVLGRELDLWYPDKNVAIEYNGDYWHSVSRNPSGHISKTTICESKGVHLINIFERIWKTERNKVINILDNNLDKGKLLAPIGDVREVSVEQAQEFIRANNIEKVIPAKFHIGTFKNNELLNLLSFNQDKFSVNIRRFTTKMGYIEDYKFLIDYIESYFSPSYMDVSCNRLYYDGSLFSTLGFTKVETTKADFNYVYNLSSVSRDTYRKNPSKYKKYHKVYDCGRVKLRFNLSV